jgi:hypothetical protein
MPPLTLNIPHDLGLDEARRRIDHGFVNLQQQMAGGMMSLVTFERTWQGDRLHFTGRSLGQTIQGRIDVRPDSVYVEVDLPALLTAIADKITGRLRQETKKLLEKK